MHQEPAKTPHCFMPFKASIDSISLPKRFTYPFCYEPHPLSLIATKQLQSFLQSQFELKKIERGLGRMLGVLVVQDQNKQLGFLSAVSGKANSELTSEYFVPPVFDMDITTKDKKYTDEQAVINAINHEITTLESNPDLKSFELDLENAVLNFETQINQKKQQMTIDKKARKAKRASEKDNLSPESFKQLNDELNQQSIENKLSLRDLKNKLQDNVDVAKRKFEKFKNKIDQLKELRKTKSNALQKLIFEQYQLLNSKGEIKNLSEIFKLTPRKIPPAGSGDCAAPKLLQYAFTNQLKPIAMAEFWWGESPKSEIRQHGNFYGSCLGKCQPILEHMLDGLEVDDNPLLKNPALGKELEIIYQDSDLLIVNKPSEFLSVPGKNIEDSVYTRIKAMFPNNDSPFIVHRLDMSTSGLMVVALNKKVHKKLQKQFIERTVNKTYVALIEGDLKQAQGSINLPLRGDIDDRPRQMVCEEHGKRSETSWKVLERIQKDEKVRTKVELKPITGRTHQLRVHCAHSLGLNMPIVGDDLYGRIENRLHLHAQTLEFTHPNSKEVLKFKVDSEF